MSKEKKITMRIIAQSNGTVASIRIVDYIGEYEKASSKVMRDQVDAFLRDGVTDAEVYINSRGGNVFEATEIANELARIKNVTVTVGTLAASAATYITSKFKTTARPNSQFMIHRPKLYTGGDIRQIENDLKLLKNITADYQAVYAAKTGKTAEQIETMWASGDYWMTAQEALKEGFIDEVTSATDAPEAVTEQDIALLEACGAPIIPTPKIPNTTNMDRLQLIASLGLAADATDAQINAAIQSNKEKAEKLAQLEADADKEKGRRVTELVAAAVRDKKITSEEVPHYEKLATADYDSTAAVLKSKTAIPKLSAQLNPKAKESEEDARKDWTIDDYLEKDPEALAKLEEDQPEVFARLNDAYFKAK